MLDSGSNQGVVDWRSPHGVCRSETSQCGLRKWEVDLEKVYKASITESPQQVMGPTAALVKRLLAKREDR